MKTEIDLDSVFDLCVIGAGPAGIITILEYQNQNPDKKVILIEYGFPEQKSKNSLNDSIIIKDSLNHHHPNICTVKGMGGSSDIWGGRCVIYDDIDFMDRPVLAWECTWSLDLYNEVKCYTYKAAEYFECGKPVFNLHDMPEFGNKRIAEGFEEGVVTDTVIERWSRPTRFGKRYKEKLDTLNNLNLLQGYEARDFICPDKDGLIRELTIRNVINKQELKIQAHNFVIAAGAQESTRILLRNKQLFDLLGYLPPALGKYYQGHLSGKIASVIFSGDPRKTDYEFMRNADGTYIKRRFQFTTDYLLKNNLLNTAMWLDNPLYPDPNHHNGAMSLMYLAMITPGLGEKLAPPAVADGIVKCEKKNVHKHIVNVIKDLPGSIIEPAKIFYKKYLPERKLPGVFLYNAENKYALNFHSEQIPTSSNYMELAPDGEKLVINYGVTDTDINSVIKLHETLDQWLQECNCGKLQYWYEKEELFDVIRNNFKSGTHQLGTTRIAASPKDGVVDNDLKVWGTNNVYVCSSSVFPTSGQANPTFFLGTFAVRLASHLAQKSKR